MSRPKHSPTAADIAAEIRRLEAEQSQAVAAEDQRRGMLIREYLGGRDGGALRAVLARFATSRDAFLFEIGNVNASSSTTTSGTRRRRTPPTERATSRRRTAADREADVAAASTS